MATTFYATNNFTGNGSTTAWTISFQGGYLFAADVKARYFDSNGEAVDIPVTSVVGSVVTITPAVAAGVEFQIYRDTQKGTPLVDYSDGSILNEENLDLTTEQAIFVAAEAWDLSFGTRVLAQQALVLATDAQDAAVDAAASAAAAALSAANAATDANTAITTANGAVDTANLALDAAQDAETAAVAAQDAAEDAELNASNAVNLANAKVAKAGDTMTGILAFSQLGTAAGIQVGLRPIAPVAALNAVNVSSDNTSTTAIPAVNGHATVSVSKRASADTDAAVSVTVRRTTGANSSPIVVDYAGSVNMTAASAIELGNNAFVGTAGLRKTLNQYVTDIASASGFSEVAPSSFATFYNTSISPMGTWDTVNGGATVFQSGLGLHLSGMLQVESLTGTAAGNFLWVMGLPTSLPTFLVRPDQRATTARWGTGMFHDVSANVRIPVCFGFSSNQGSTLGRNLFLMVYRIDTGVSLTQTDFGIGDNLTFDLNIMIG